MTDNKRNRNNKAIRIALWVIGIPTVYALLLRLIFGIEGFRGILNVMSISFLFSAPAIMGALTVYFSPIERVEKLWYRIFVPWVPVFAFFCLTILLSWEGWACWIMVLPLFLIAASVGGLIGGYFKLRKKDNKLYVSILCFLPLLLSPVEHFIGTIPATFEAMTYIDIQASPEKIWDHVTRVKEIPAEKNKGWLTKSLGFPRPIKAELNYLGNGASRQAIFSKGLIFHETVTEYIDKKKMVFTIKAYPYEIPSTTMDEHIVIGGQYFDVLNGTYELKQLNPTTYRLYLYSHFKINTSFNFYAGLWAKWIMSDIQNNILQIEKQRAEE